MRTPRQVDLEWQERTAKIRAAARKGKRPAEIAVLYQIPVAAVERALTPINHPRLSDPVQLLQTLQADVGMAPADVQIYWVGFLMAAGRICGYGTALTLVVTLGEHARESITPFVTDLLAITLDRCEFCRSSIGGWQVYLRDQTLCKALLPWGVPSDLHGDDAALLGDLPSQFAIPLIRGYIDGTWTDSHSASGGEDDRLILEGSAGVLTELNALVGRSWAISGRVVTRRQNRALLRFSASHGGTIRGHLDGYAYPRTATAPSEPQHMVEGSKEDGTWPSKRISFC
jgi:hypothetical protein